MIVLANHVLVNRVDNDVAKNEKHRLATVVFARSLCGAAREGHGATVGLNVDNARHCAVDALEPRVRAVWEGEDRP